MSMMASPVTLLGSSLVFDRTGQTLVAVEPDAISVVELGAGGHTTRLRDPRGSRGRRGRRTAVDRDPR